MLLEGMQLGRYALIKRIGGGGMGDVYLAEDPHIGQNVAIKVIKTEATLHVNTLLVHDFQDEARVIAQFDHPHIMPLLAYSEEEIHGDTVAYIVMPYRKEGNLIQWLRQRSQSDSLSPIELGQLIQQAASALKYAHDRNIIHRDIKPANFLVRENPDAPRQPDLLLSDFGLAKLTDATSSASQQVRGTPAYMAPEQWSGTAVAASDQYSLAVMAYELLCGRTPFKGSPLQMMHLHLNATPPPPSSFNPLLPEGVDQVLLRALQKNPTDRFPGVLAFANTLLQALGGLPFSVNTIQNEPALAVDTRAKTESIAQKAHKHELPQEANRKITLYPDTGKATEPRLRKTRLLFTLLAAAVALLLAAGSLTLAFSAHNLAATSGRIASQSALTNNSASSGTHLTGQGSTTPHPKSPTPKPKTSSKTPVTNPTPQPTTASTPVINPTPQPQTPTPQTQTPTPQPPTPTPQPPTLCLDENPQSLTLSGTQGVSNEQFITITNCSSAAETWTSYQKTNDGYNWIRTQHTSYTLNPGASQSEGVQANLSGLGAGTYTGYLSYYIGSTRMVTVIITLTVQQVLCLQANPTSLTLYGTLGQSVSNELFITIANCSNGTETWTSYQQTNDGYNWIRTQHTSYTLNPGASQSEGVQANLSGLGAGTYTGYLSYYIGSTRMVTVTITLVVS